jgi:phage terminase small subunit
VQKKTKGGEEILPQEDSTIVQTSLTAKEEEFVHAYCETLNKTRAYYAVFGKTDTSSATKMIERPHVYQAIATQLQKNLDAEVARSPNLLLKYIERYMELDPSEYYDDDGKVKPLSSLDIDKRLLVSNVTKQVNNRTGAIVLSYALPDKTKLLDKLSELVRFVAQVRAMTGDTLDLAGEAARKRDEIFLSAVNENEVTFKMTDEEVRE